MTREQRTADDGEIVVARLRGRSYEVPRVCSVFMFKPWEMDLELSATVEVVSGGQVRVRSIEVRSHTVGDGALQPIELQRIPWGKVAEHAIAANLVERGRRANPTEREAVLGERERGRRSEWRSARERDFARGRTRSKVDRSVLVRVLELREEAKRQGEVPWDTWAGEQLGYSRGYMRQLLSRARRELG